MVVKMARRAYHVSMFTTKPKRGHPVNFSGVLRYVKALIFSWRPYSFPASVLPVCASAALIFSHDRQSQWHLLPWIITGVIFLHIGTNLINDLEDYRRGIDTDDFPGSSGMLMVIPPLTKRIITVQVFISMGTGFIIALFLVIERGPLVLIPALIGFFSSYAYSGPPYGLKYRGVGDILVFITLGPLSCVGTFYVLTGTVTFSSIILSIPLGALATSILHANNMRDCKRDKNAGITTLALGLGHGGSRFLFLLLLLMAYVTPLYLVLSSLSSPWILLCEGSLVVALKPIREVLRGDERELETIDKKMAGLFTLYSLLLIIGLLAEGW